VKDAPDLQTVEGLRNVPGFIDQYITTKIPPEGEDDELRTLVMGYRDISILTHAKKMVDVGAGLIILNNLALSPVLRHMLMEETRLGFIL